MGHEIIQEDKELTDTSSVASIRILASTLQRTDVASDSAPDSDTASSANNDIADLRNEIATLETLLAEEQQRHTQLLLRHQSLLQTFTEQHTRLQQAVAECHRLREAATLQLQRRRQRDMFIIKQAKEIQRLRGQCPDSR